MSDKNGSITSHIDNFSGPEIISRGNGTASMHQVDPGEDGHVWSWTRCGCIVEPGWNPLGHLKQSLSTLSAAHVPCWNCGNLARKPAGFFCQSCDLIQPTSPAVDLFAIMGM